MVLPSSAVFLHLSLTVMEDPTQGIWKIAFAAALTFSAMSAMMVAFLPFNKKTTACALDHYPVCLNCFLKKLIYIYIFRCFDVLILKINFKIYIYIYNLNIFINKKIF